MLFLIGLAVGVALTAATIYAAYRIDRWAVHVDVTALAQDAEATGARVVATAESDVARALTTLAKR